MFLLEINWLAVVIGFVAFFVIGAVWFGPKTFYPAWSRALGVDPAASHAKHPMAVIFGMTALGGLVQVVALASIMHLVGAHDPASGALTGLLLGIGLVAASSLSHRLFSGQGFRAWAIEVSGDIVGLTVAGLLVGLFG